MQGDHGGEVRAGIEPGLLYVVATPIGNLGDIGLRALAVLKGVDLIAAEDTRITRRLLGHYGIATRLMPLHEHNEADAARKLAAELAQGRSAALVSDAGTPGISDPGARAVAAVRAAGHRVVPVPGPSAAAAALSAAGGTAAHYLFYGFLPAQAAARRAALEGVAALELPDCALVFYEAPHRITACVAELAAVLGAGRGICIARELTKLYESVHRCTLGEAGPWLAADADRRRGEFVLVVDAAPPRADATAEKAARVLDRLPPDMAVKQAVALACELTGARRNEVYAMALAKRGRGKA